MKYILFFFLASSVALAQLPDAFKINTATNRQVQLSWTGSQQTTVERKTLSGAYAAISTTATTPYTDSAIVGWETYTYRLRSGTATSAEITVGPPPFGYNTVVPSPATDLAEVKLGRGTRLIPDGNGDPMIALVRSDQSNPGDANNGLYFIRWDRLNYKWTVIQKLATVDRYTTKTRVGFARDSSTGTLAIAFDNDKTNGVELYASTNNGQSWFRSALTVSETTLTEPHIASVGGIGSLTYLKSGKLRLRKGSVTTAISTWTESTPIPGDPDIYTWYALETDSLSNVWLAYTANESSGVNTYTQKLGSNRVLVDRSIGDGTGIVLTFTGANPRILLDGAFDNNYFYGENNWFYRSNDGGATWSKRVLIPQDGGNGMGWPFALTVDSKGNGAMVAPVNGGNDGDTKCGAPKLSRSSNLTSWITCAPQGTKQLIQEPDSPDMILGNGEELMILYDQTKRFQPDIAAGLVFWRENSFGAVVTPAISSGGVVNAASFAASIAPGGLVTLFGSNLSGATSSASALPLPTTLAGTSVLVNGRSSPLIYVSPTQINFQLPYETASGSAAVVVQSSGSSSNNATATVIPAAPGLLVYGNNRLVAVNQDGSLNADGSGETPNRIVVMYGTGQGAIDNAIATGAGAPSSPLSRPRASVAVKIGTATAAFSFAGLTPGFVGLLQLNVTVPSLLPGNYPVTLTIGGATSNTPLFTVR